MPGTFPTSTGYDVLKKNILANIAGRIWAVLAAYLFTPLYLQFLGAEAFGLVGFFTTLVGVLAFADLGLTATLNREMARLSGLPNSGPEMADVLRSLEIAYAGISLILALLVWLLAPVIAGHWLQASKLDAAEMTLVIRLMGLALASQLPGNLYIGGLMGLQRQVMSNGLQVGCGALRGIGAALILWLVSPTAEAFFYWQLGTSILFSLGARQSLYGAISAVTHDSRFKWTVFRDVGPYALGMGVLAFLSTVLLQTDKLVVSKILPLEVFGYYVLAATLAGVSKIMASSIGSAVFPRLTSLAASNAHADVVELYRRASTLVAVAVIPGALTLALFPSESIFAWTGNATAAQQGILATRFLVIGDLIQALLVVPYLLTLAYGNIRLNLQVAMISVLVITPLQIFLTTKYGLVGAGVSWLLLNLGTLPIYLFYLHRRILPTAPSAEYALGLIRPILVALPPIALARWIAPQIESRVLNFGVVALTAIVATALTALATSDVRVALRRYLSRPLRIANLGS